MKSGYVAILGLPNVGKSTLLNRLIGEHLAIVTPKPQTTRQRILGILTRPDAQVIFLDTPGFHRSRRPLNKLMLGEIDKALEDADVVLLMLEPRIEADEVGLGELGGLAGLGGLGLPSSPSLPNSPVSPNPPAFRNRPCIIVINKIDTVISEPWGRVVDRYSKAFGGLPTIAVSAMRGDGCDDLIGKIIELLPEGEPFYPADLYTDHPVRFLASEIIREQAMLLLHQELPYCLAVEIEEFKEPLDERGITRIHASIIVEKDSQKGIVIGAGGNMIKKIGQRAREKIEDIVGTRVYLELFVKVDKDWTNMFKSGMGTLL